MSESDASAPGDSAHAVVTADGVAELVVDGVTHRFAAPSAADADEIVTEFVAGRAADQGRVLTLEIKDPDGEWVLMIHPDGTVHEAGSPPPERRGRRQLAESELEPAEETAASGVPSIGPRFDSPSTGPAFDSPSTGPTFDSPRREPTGP
ncbi:MAG TPA: hypothetical protein VIM26_00740, partial [Pengzhenrongella sp.]